ncbi:hypothetical protein GCM10022244_40630 [Streptomyces gulbargensis]|uniref:Peptidoglycan binding domain-containing protein n=1 Tax=Streptomyces gulbargensis TaxID=364901 RepID=A0ABP7MPA9_9ACTN
MSRETGRETDSPSSGAQGRGGAAYPSGTPPYGSRQYPALHPTQDAPEETPAAPAPPEEPKTETTLTTRIRINIPGSRPIPPVVVRKPVTGSAEPEPAPEPAAPAPEPEPAPQAAPEPPRAEEPAPAPAKPKETSDWFAPRKPAAQAPAAGPAPASPQAPVPAPAPKPAAAPKPSPGPGRQTPGTGFAGSASSGVPTVGSAPSSRPVTSQAAPGNPLYDTGTPAAGTPAYQQTPPNGTPLDDGPAAAGPAHDGTPAAGTPAYQQTPPNGTPLHDGAAGVPGHPGPAAAAPTGPTTGPVPGTATFGGPGAQGPAGPQGGRGAGAPRMSDDTAILTPQQPAPKPAPGAPGRPGDGGHISGDTLSSGMPAVPASAARRTPEPAPARSTEEAPAPAPRPAAPAQSRAARKKGRSKLVLAAAGLVGIAGVAYGAGLLLNHSDVPKGTTVLGVDIGGGTKEEAVNKLEAALGKRTTTPLKLSVGGKKVELAPDKAGLSLDSQETVRAAAGSDYNPVSVIGSLFGGERVAKPVFPVDEEKLAVALRDLAGTSASATEGTILFSPNKVTPVEGRPGKALDIQRSMISVRDAYRAQVETGAPNVVELPVTTRQPTVTKAELDRAMRDFAQPAMSDLIRIKAGDKYIDFGPARSLPQILSMKAVDGRLVEVYDKKAIERLLDGAFEGIMITKGDGTKHEVSADDVAYVMRDALRGKTRAERTRAIDLSGEG